MTNKKTIPAKDLISDWSQDPAFVNEYTALEEEFALAAAVIAARTYAGLTQTELAEKMGTSQSAIARLEGGRSKPSTSTLEKLAQATGTKLRISFEPDSAVPA